jgi:hypothetical protein
VKKYRPMPGWRPDELLESAAARRGLTVEQYRERMAELVEESRVNGPHLTLQGAKDAAAGVALSDREIEHLDGCAFCAQMVANIEATEERVLEFEQALARSMKEDCPAHAGGGEEAAAGHFSPVGRRMVS